MEIPPFGVASNTIEYGHQIHALTINAPRPLSFTFSREGFFYANTPFTKS